MIAAPAQLSLVALDAIVRHPVIVFVETIDMHLRGMSTELDSLGSGPTPGEP